MIAGPTSDVAADEALQARDAASMGASVKLLAPEL